MKDLVPSSLSIIQLLRMNEENAELKNLQKKLERFGANPYLMPPCNFWEWMRRIQNKKKMVPNHFFCYHATFENEREEFRIKIKKKNRKIRCQAIFSYHAKTERFCAKPYLLLPCNFWGWTRIQNKKDSVILGALLLLLFP